MFKTHTIGRSTACEYTLFAFRTEKGTFTLVGTETRVFENEKHITATIDTWRNITTGEFHEWQRSSIKSWWEQGKIKPMEEATTMVWHQNQRRPSKERPQSKVIQK